MGWVARNLAASADHDTPNEPVAYPAVALAYSQREFAWNGTIGRVAESPLAEETELGRRPAASSSLRIRCSGFPSSPTTRARRSAKAT